LACSYIDSLPDISAEAESLDISDIPAQQASLTSITVNPNQIVLKAYGEPKRKLIRFPEENTQALEVVRQMMLVFDPENSRAVVKELLQGGEAEFFCLVMGRFSRLCLL
jgi:phosphoribosylamine-glycine ligase